MRKIISLGALLPLLTACEEVQLPFIAPLTIPMDGVSEEGVDGLYRLNASSEEVTLDDLRNEMPDQVASVNDFTVTALTLSDPGARDDLIDPEYDELIDPEYDELIDPEYDELIDPEYDELIDPEYDELSDFAVNAAIYISSDAVLDEGDDLLAFVDEFENDQAHYEANVSEHAQLSRYEDTSFHVIVTATFNKQPPESLHLPLLISGHGTVDPMEVIQ